MTHQEGAPGQVFTLPQALTEEWLVYVLRGLGWEYTGRIPNQETPAGFQWGARTLRTALSWGEKITFTPLAPNVVHVHSQSVKPALLDPGPNHANETRFGAMLVQAMSTPPQGSPQGG